MSNDRAQFTYHNSQNETVELTIEPWGIIEEIPSGGTATFETNIAPPPEIEFSITEENQPFIFVMSERVRISINDVMKHEFSTNVRPPEGSFRLLNKLLFSKFSETKARKS